jgi:formate dehydrogenase
MLYFDRHSLSAEREKELGCKREEDLDTMLSKCDVVIVNTPLSDQTRGLFNKERIAKMKKGAYLVNNARGAIADKIAVKEACESGQLGGMALPHKCSLPFHIFLKLRIRSARILIILTETFL